MKKIDIDNWERKSHYNWFSSFADPTMALDVKMDITALLEFCKRRKVSSFAAVMYIACDALNKDEAFRLRVSDGEVVCIDYANVAYTIMVNDRYFVNCRARMNEGFKTFLDDVEANRKKFNGSNFVQQQYNNVSVIDDIYCSCLPWINFTSVKQPIPDNSDESKSIPRICWGKYFTEGERTYLTLNITANHALVDGINFGSVFDRIQEVFDDPERALG